jgi:16S rRNA (guanine966-N2)-methyltransferase
LVYSLRASQQRLGATALRIEQADALPWLARCPRERFELIFLDPPFDSSLALRAVAAARPALRPGGLIYLEHSKPWANEVPGLTLHRQARAGAVHYHLLRGYTESAAPPSPRERPAS